jgi:hypothetical protein
MLTIFPYWSSSFTVGGHQTVKHKHLLHHPLLRRFPISRVWSALLCSQYNAEMPRNKVISAAAEKMLSHFHQAKEASRSHKQDNVLLREAIDPIWSDPLCWLALWANHTLVCHPVGYHQDVFSKNSSDTIENKIMLLSMGRTRWDENVPLGRTGFGNSCYTFCLLDWS